jgi:hypothetical protein
LKGYRHRYKMCLQDGSSLRSDDDKISTSSSVRSTPEAAPLRCALEYMGTRDDVAAKFLAWHGMIHALQERLYIRIVRKMDGSNPATRFSVL